MKTKLIIVLLLAGFAMVSYGLAKENALDLSGTWSGNWISDNSGHSGPMKAVFRSVGAESYEVTFSGRFFKVIPFRYKVVLSVKGKDGEKLLLSGNQRLFGFGTFEYTAVADESSFSASYSSRKDNGRFELSKTR